MLVDRGCDVVSFDRVPSEFAGATHHVGDITNFDDVLSACSGAATACVYHVAAAVGPYHPQSVYRAVNYEGTLNVIAACRQLGIPKLVMASSPSTRFQWGVDIDGPREDELPPLPLPEYMQAYAATKAEGELALRDQFGDALLTVAVAPHQVYGPRDSLFLPAVLDAAARGRLRRFGADTCNRVAFTFVDNYCHALMCAEKALAPGAACCGGFYIATDGATHPYEAGYAHFWDTLDDACVATLGVPSFQTKLAYPLPLLRAAAAAAAVAERLFGAKLKLNAFALQASTMHRWFNTEAAARDLGYAPIVPFDEGWRRTTAWFAAEWRPRWEAERARAGFSGLFFRRKFLAHRLGGLLFLVQYVISVPLYLYDYPRWLASPLPWSVPLTGFLQSVNAARTFTFLPKRADPGFAAVADASSLSYYTVVENSFYSMQCLFASCYLHDALYPAIRRLVIVEPLLVFLVFWFRDLWPASRISAALGKKDKSMSDAHRLKLTVSAYAIKAFYIYAKHYVGFFPLYLRFLGRLDADDTRLLFGVQVLSSYAATVSIFIHTLKFKGYIGPIAAMVAYDVIIPGFLYLYANMLPLLLRNADVALVVAAGMVLNLAPRPAFHVYQGCVAAAFYAGWVGAAPLEVQPSAAQAAAAAACVVGACVAMVTVVNPRK